MRNPKTEARENGSMLLITVLLLLLMALLGFAALDTAGGDQQVAGFQNRRDLALFAADAGLATALEALTTTRTPAVPNTNLGDGSIYPHGQPSFRLDPSVAEPIESIGAGAFPGMSINIVQGGAPTYMLRYWRIRVQGDEAAGSMARVEAVAGALITN
jgi:hypothetical protein